MDCRFGSDPMLLWLWHRPAPRGLIRPLAWEPPYAAGAAQEKAKKKKKKVRTNSLINMFSECFYAQVPKTYRINSEKNKDNGVNLVMEIT